MTWVFYFFLFKKEILFFPATVPLFYNTFVILHYTKSSWHNTGPVCDFEICGSGIMCITWNTTPSTCSKIYHMSAKQWYNMAIIVIFHLCMVVDLENFGPCCPLSLQKWLPFFLFWVSYKLLLAVMKSITTGLHS